VLGADPYGGVDQIPVRRVGRPPFELGATLGQCGRAVTDVDEQVDEQIPKPFGVRP
jgi:hypothetical protein